MKESRGNLDRAFNPRTVAVVGDKRENDYMWLRSLSTFEGKVYSVQIDPQELPGIAELGVENHASLLDISEPVDYVIVAVPCGVTPIILADCIKKGVGGVTLFTSGFAETHTEQGIKLQQVITEMAKQANLKLVGPNCMGIYNPRIGLRHSLEQYSGEGGSVGFIAQSGTHATFFSIIGALNGIKVSKSVSYGNAAVLDSADYLEYMAEDEETQIIGMYIEGVREGRKLFQCLRKITGRKPVLIWKGGREEEGARAAASHTASMAQSQLLWQSLIRQCGAIEVSNLDEMIDTTKALLYLKPPLGRRVGLIAVSGGQSVVIADAFNEAGLSVPRLSEDSYREFASFFNIVGGSYMNPLDISWNMPSIEYLVRLLDTVGNDRNIDSVALEVSAFFLNLRWGHWSVYIDRLVNALTQFKERCPKPFLTIVIAAQLEAEALEIRTKLAEKGIPSFPSFERSAEALEKVERYYRFHRVRD